MECMVLYRWVDIAPSLQPASPQACLPPSLCIQHGLESRALSANTPSQHRQWGGYALRLAHQPILSCVIRSVLMSLWTHSCGIKVNPTPALLQLYAYCLSAALSSISMFFPFPVQPCHFTVHPHWTLRRALLQCKQIPSQNTTTG